MEQKREVKIPRPLQNLAVRHYFQCLYNAIVLSNENAQTLESIKLSDEPTHYLKYNTGNWLAQSSFSTVLRWLSNVKQFFPSEKYDLCILSPLRFLVSQFHKMKKTYNHENHVNGILIDKSPKQYEKNYRKEMISATIFIPKWKKTFCLKYFADALENVPIGKIRMWGVFPIFYVNRLRPFDSTIESVTQDYSLSEMEKNLCISIPEIPKICSSCYYSLYSDLYSEQKQSRFLGASLIIIGKIVTTRPLIIIQNPTTKDFVRFYPTEKLLKSLGTDSYGLSEYEGQWAKTLGFFWYRFGTYVPEFAEAISIELVPKDEVSKYLEKTDFEIAQEEKLSMNCCQLPEALHTEGLEFKSLVNLLQRNHDLFHNLIELCKAADTKEEIKVSGRRNRQIRKDGYYLEWLGLVNIYHSKSKWVIKVTHRGSEILYAILRDKAIKKILEYLDKFDIVSLSKIRDLLSSGFQIPNVVIERAIKDLKRKEMVFTPKAIGTESSHFFDSFIIKKPVDKNEEILEKYMFKLENTLLSILCSVRHGLGWSKIVEHLDSIASRFDENMISSVLAEDLKNVCEGLLEKRQLVKKGNCWVYPYRNRILDLLQNNPEMFFDKVTISDQCSIPQYELPPYLKKLVKSDLISKTNQFYAIRVSPEKDKMRKKVFVISWAERKIISLLKNRKKVEMNELINKMAFMIFPFARKLSLNVSSLDIATTAIVNLKTKKTIINKNGIIYLLNSKIGDG